jgi:nitrate/TMAO reductase-like tetraheme cytochrome c subunit
MRQCNECGTLLEFTDTNFRPYRNKKGKTVIHKVCRECEREYTRVWYSKCDKKKLVRDRREYQTNYRIAHRTEIQDSYLKRRFGISRKEVNRMARKQNGECAICKKAFNEIKQSRQVDHDHVTGKVRGILCHKCNRGLGLFNDNPGTLLAAASYVTT